MNLTILPNGSIRFIHDDELAIALKGIGQITIERASHVEPLGEEWTADLSPVGGPLLGPFTTRREALDAEVAWLRSKGY